MSAGGMASPAALQGECGHRSGRAAPALPDVAGGVGTGAKRDAGCTELHPLEGDK